MLKVDENNLEEVLRNHKTVFLCFHMLSCPFCRRFKPIFDKYSEIEKGTFAEAVIDDYENPLWDKFDIKKVPTVILFKDGKQVVRKDAKSTIGLTEEDVKDILAYVH